MSSRSKTSSGEIENYNHENVADEPDNWYRFQCKDCGFTTGSQFRTPKKAFQALPKHVSCASNDDHIGWSEYLVKYQLNPCADCGTPLDTITLDRCYTCRMHSKALQKYIDARE